jgi:hypothetical protein
MIKVAAKLKNQKKLSLRKLRRRNLISEKMKLLMLIKLTNSILKRKSMN